MKNNSSGLTKSLLKTITNMGSANDYSSWNNVLEQFHKIQLNRYESSTLMKSQLNRKKSSRHTIMLDDEVAVRLRKLQSEKIRKTSSTVSFSHIINEILRKGV